MEPEIEAAMPYLSSRGITPETAEKFVLTYDRAQDAIKIPYFDARGRIVESGAGVAQRNLGWKPSSKYPPKYEWPKDTPRHIYNVVDADHPYVYVTEGEFDCLILKQLGLYAVGIPGVNNFKPEWIWLFPDQMVRLMFDADIPKEREDGKVLRPGQDAATKLRRMLRRVTDDVEIVWLPEGEDVTSLFMADRLKEVLPL